MYHTPMYLNVALDKALHIFGKNKKYSSNYPRNEGYLRRARLNMTKNIKFPALPFSYAENKRK